MPAQALILALVIIAGASVGVIVGRLLTATGRRAEEPVAPPVELVPTRDLEMVLAPYEHVAAA